MGGVRRDWLVYGLGVIAQRAASIILLPIYTRLLTPADYGLLELLELTVEVTAILVSAGTMAGILRYYYKRETEEERNELISSVYVLLGALNVIGAVLLCLFATPVHRVALGGEGQPWFLYIVAARFVLSTGTLVPMSYMQATRAPQRFVASSMSILAVQVTLNIVFVVWLRMGVLGVLLAGLIGSFLASTVLSTWLFRRVGFRTSRSTMRELRRFGVPYQLAQAGGFILTFGDRFFLQTLESVAAVGIYALAYKFGFLTFSFAAGPYLRAWKPHRFEIASAPREERDAEYNRGFRMLSLIVLPIAVAVATGARPLLRVMSDPEFLPAASLVPVIVSAYVIQAWTDASRFGIEVSERTIFHTLAVWTSVVVILGAYATLIPRYGALGAALATVVGFTVRFGMTYLFAQRLWPVDLVWGPHLMTGAAAVAVTGGFVALPDSLSILLEVAASITAVSLVAGIGFFVLLDRSARTEAIRFVTENVLRRPAPAGDGPNLDDA